MIVDFTVTNYRSIKSEQTLSLHADNKPKHHAGNIRFSDDNVGVLRTCAIYGSNAAGKTNFLRAFESLQDLIVESRDLKEGDIINDYQPYLLSEETKRSSTIFEVEFYVDNIRYVYLIEYDAMNIHKEQLSFYPNGGNRLSNIFNRTSASDWKSIKFGDRYKGGRKQFAYFANNSYLSIAGSSPDAPEMIRVVYSFFRKNIAMILSNHKVGVFGWDEDSSSVSIINTFLKKVDLGISGFEIENGEPDPDFKFPEGMPDEIVKKLQNEFSKKEFFLHPNEDGTLTRFEGKQESKGTIRLFKMLPFFIQVLKKGKVLMIDEIESSYHPHIAELIIRLFNDPLVNKNGAQLIFTTHDLSLMSADTMRKDQINLLDKDVKNGTEISNLDDFDSTLKDSSPFEKWYDEGRLGGIPKINYREISEAIKKDFRNAEEEG